MLSVCNNLGIPVVIEKLEGPATTITFLGIEIEYNTPPDSKLTSLQDEL